jgi:hypothetical protein
MLCFENYCKRAMLQEVSSSKRRVNKASILVMKVLSFYFLLHNLVYVWYISANYGISDLHMVTEPFLGPSHCELFFLITEIWGKS